MFVASGGGFTVPADYTFDWFVTSSDFTGTVELQDNTTIGSLYMAGGNIAMVGSPGSGNDLNITVTLNFTGGTLNSSSTLGTVHLTGANGFGATANLNPQSGAITIGSTISLEGLGTATTGAGMSIFLGNYTIKNGADFNVGDYCDMQVGFTPFLPIPATSKVGFETVAVPNGGKPYTGFLIAKNGFCTFVHSFEGKVRVVDKGAMTVKTGAVVKLTDPVDPAGVAQSVLVDKTGTLNLENNSTLSVVNLIYVAGTFNTVYVADVANQTVLIIGELFVDKVGSVIIADAAPANKFNRLTVTGNITLDGTLKMHVDGAGAGKDFVDTSKIFLVLNQA